MSGRELRVELELADGFIPEAEGGRELRVELEVAGERVELEVARGLISESEAFGGVRTKVKRPLVLREAGLEYYTLRSLHIRR